MAFDAIVIGSGFGGAITGCRLALAGYRVLILERGRRWDNVASPGRTPYPREVSDPWVWNQERPEHLNGWFEIRSFPNMTVLAGAGVGGGSLVYANVSAEAPAHRFDQGWPAEITYAELKPYYDKVAQFLNVQTIPNNQWTERTRLMHDGAAAIGEEARFRPVELAVSFDADWTYDQPDPFNPAKSKRFLNAQGVEQGTCVHLGHCDLGCDVKARNTLDVTYIPVAEKHGAEVRPLHVVTNIAPAAGGYRVSWDRIEDGRRIPGAETARIVIVAAGSIGSTELLLRCRDEAGTLQGLPWLGRNWSSNGDFLTPAYHPDREVSFTKGPTISSIIDFLDGSFQGHSFWVQDGGFPDAVTAWLRHLRDQPRADQGFRTRLLLDAIQHLLDSRDPFRHVMPWFAQAVDAGDGVLRLKRPWWFFGRPHLHLDWDAERSEAAINAVVAMHKKLAEATGGKPLVPPTWSLAKDLVTPHPLGGCNMSASPEAGVVDHKGEVFGHKNLYVADGAVIPEALGVNPSRTIAAVAERIAAKIIEDGR